MIEPKIHIALHEPLIPQNTGNIGRLALGLNAALHIIHPIGFDMSEKAVRRSGLDYWKHVDIREHSNEAAFFEWLGDRTVHLVSKKGVQPYSARQYQYGDVLLFGKETTGLPSELLERFGSIKIPMFGATRSLNLSNAVAVVAYHAVRDICPKNFMGADEHG